MWAGVILRFDEEIWRFHLAGRLFLGSLDGLSDIPFPERKQLSSITSRTQDLVASFYAHRNPLKDTWELNGHWHGHFYKRLHKIPRHTRCLMLPRLSYSNMGLVAAWVCFLHTSDTPSK